MIYYIQAEFYRICRKKSMYVFFFILLLFMFLGLYSSARTITQQSLASVAQVSLMLFGTLASAYLFNMIYNDELQAKTVASVVGRGNGRATIVIVKLLLNMILSAIVFIITVCLFISVLFILGISLSPTSIIAICKNALFVALRGIAIGSIASIVIYGVHKGGLALGIFMLTTLGFFTQIVLFVLDKLKLTELSQYLLNPIVAELVDRLSLESGVAYVLYVALFTVLAIVVFKQKDLDF